MVITNLKNKMSNFIQEIHLDMLAWGSLEDQVDKRAVAEIVATPTKKKEKDDDKKLFSAKRTSPRPAKNKKTLNQLLQGGTKKTPKSKQKAREQSKAWEKKLGKKWKDKMEKGIEDEESPRHNSIEDSQLQIPIQ